MPSLLSADFANLQTSIEVIPSADGLHLDVMDNDFVPNLTLGLPVVEAIRAVTDRLLDIHLMIEDPDRWALRRGWGGIGHLPRRGCRCPRTARA